MKQAGPRALAFCEKPQGATKIALIFGADPGLVSTSADTLAYNWLPSPDPFNIIKMSDDDLKRDPQLLADELVARSLMGGERLVRVRVDKDASSKYLIEVLADVEKGILTPEAFWIIEAGELNKTNKLRVGFEESKSAIALQLYADDEAAVSDLVTKRLAAAGVIGRPLGRHVAAIEEEARGAVLFDISGTERLRQEAETALAPEVDLPEPVAGGVVTLQEESVALRLSEDVRDAPMIDDDLGRRREAAHGPFILSNGCGKRALGGGGEARGQGNRKNGRQFR